MSRRYTIITGYHDEPVNKFGVDPLAFFETWLANTRGCFPDAVATYVFDTCPRRLPASHDQVRWLRMAFNPGHAHDLDKGVIDFPAKLCGCTLSTITGMLMAYYNNSDMLFKEQDCLTFNMTADTLYEALGDKSILLGPPEHTGCNLACESSLHLVRRDYIPGLVARLLAHPAPDAGPGFKRQEAKWMDCVAAEDLALLPFGYGRLRPECGCGFSHAGPWYMQQIKFEELIVLDLKGLI